VSPRPPVAVALDAPDLATATHWATELEPFVTTLKVGLELFDAVGQRGVEQVRAAAPSCALFLDVKLHDIPHTVAGAARALKPLQPDLLTVHALGGSAMVRAACEALPETLITGVTVLTSMSAADQSEVGIAGAPEDAVLRLAEIAVGAGARGLVCSPHEVAAVRQVVGPDVRLITPGVRPAGAAVGDQRRVATPVQALRDGADLLVIGRPITAAEAPAEAAARIAADINAQVIA
jgi:orotidine-5'-phosphate decarboxylase